MGIFLMKCRGPMILFVLLLYIQMKKNRALNPDGVALLSFKIAIVSSDGVLLQWRQEDPDPCGWKGVKCDAQTKRVIYLSLPYHKLTGSISPDIGKLKHLRVLALHNNNFYGTIPSELGNCTELQALDISSNSLGGSIPSSFGQLSKLSTLNVSANFLVGPIPFEGALTKFTGTSTFYFMASSDRQSSQRAPKAVWNSTTKKLYIDLAYEQVLAGNRQGMRFTKTGWDNIMKVFNQNTNNTYDMKKFKNHHNRLKDEWKLWDKMINRTTGFGFDPLLKTVTAADEVWADFIKAIPIAEIFQKKPLEHQNELEVIFTGIMATGDLQWAPAVGNRPRNLPNASQSHTEQPVDDTLGDFEYVPSTQMPFEGNCDQEGDAGSPTVGDNKQPRQRQRFEPSLGSRRPRAASRGAFVDSHMQMMDKYLEWKMTKDSLQTTYDIPTCVT